MSKFAWNLLSTNVIFNCTLALLGMLLAYSSSSQIRLPPRFAFICCTILSLVYALFTDEIPPLCEDPSRSSYVDNTCAFASPSGNVDLSTARWPDYGLSPEGTIILDLTSPTVLGEFAQDPYFFPTPPIAVIEEDVRIARCWKFAGSQGHVTIKLAKPIHLSNLTIYYPDYHELPSWRLKEVPKLIRVWASIPSVFDTPYTPHAPSPHSLATWEVFMGTKKSGKPVALGDVESFAHGGTFSYDVLQGTRQTFALHIPSHFWTSVVVIEVLDNLGGSTTCLHRIAVHGEEFEI
ncbi:hypothetical protein EV361DRAFT_872713 [Lentinula raphanica]|nr:hypothetical protein FB446DRAFT_708004 [Lentinula raphanica]KAJ3820758.1 hypothetical protein F5880DRAFT_1509092 [Lentinula raphanica]KAJ3966052.1 hypothetical protein EV361DRAFT_872713 [Lentinula raphanica]